MQLWCMTSLRSGGNQSSLVGHRSLHTSVFQRVINHFELWYFAGRFLTNVTNKKKKALQPHILCPRLPRSSPHSFSVWFLTPISSSSSPHPSLPPCLFCYFFFFFSLLFPVCVCVRERETDREGDRERPDTWAQFLNNVIRCERY